MAAPRTYAALLLLGFASGLPFPLVAGTLGTWLAAEGVGVRDIALVGYATLPFALKPLWAPLVDRWVPPLGRRRGWLALAQLACLASLLWLAAIGPGAGLWTVGLAAGLAALAGATQDLALGGYTAEALPAERLALGAGLSVWGYRLAVLVSGGLALNVVPFLGWGGVYLAMALLLALGLVGTLIAPEPPGAVPPASLAAAVYEPLADFRRRLGWGGFALLLAFALLYKLPDGVAALVLDPFLVRHFDLASLGLVRSLAGLAAAALGTLAAGWAVARGHLAAALWVGAVLMALSNLAYAAIDRGVFAGMPGLLATVLIDQACNAAAGTALVACLLSFCGSSAAATQYALLSAVSVVAPHLVRPWGGLPERIGWTPFFLLTCALALPGMVVLAFLARRFNAGVR